MTHFESICHKKLVEWYERNKPETEIKVTHVATVWLCKTLQNCKCIVTAPALMDGIIAEYTFNGDKGELYEDVYSKLTNTKYE